MPLTKEHLSPLFLLLPLISLSSLISGFSQDSSESNDTSLPPQSLDSVIKAGGNLWKTNLPFFATRFESHGFKWMSSDRKALRSVYPNLQMFKESVGETVVRSKKGKIYRVDISIYNRGDRGSIGTYDFNDMAERWQKHITKITKTKPEPQSKAKDSAVNLERVLWYTNSSAILLETSKTGGMAQFMRLRLAPKPKGAFYLGNNKGTIQKTVSRSDLKRNVKTTSLGDVAIQGIPMVDQGPKGYCAVASAERVFRYYGLETDQHEMAELARTTAGRGTTPSLMYDALKKASLGANLRVFSIIEWDAKKFFDTIKAYNRLAKKEHLPLAVENWRMLQSLEQIYTALDPEAYKRHKAKRGNYFKSFNTQVELNIDAGIPLFWGIRLGMYPEPEIPQAAGGHMRLIIGYNRKEKSIIYSDSWGPGHESKRMPADQAFAITNGLFIIKPSR
ncbi:MAG: hypothetical protein GXP30_10645 [Verrucomicrobia bacterium]|nr:hypothetical protein [Verrucomicrobiota bacterium]